MIISMLVVEVSEMSGFEEITVAIDSHVKEELQKNSPSNQING